MSHEVRRIPGLKDLSTIFPCLQTKLLRLITFQNLVSKEKKGKNIEYWINIRMGKPNKVQPDRSSILHALTCQE